MVLMRYNDRCLDFTLADGAVRFISENVNLTVLTRLATMADGNVTQVP